MSSAYYTVTPEPELFPKSYIVRIFKDDNLSRTVCFPVCNPLNRVKTVNQACEYGRLAVRQIMDRESAE
ncbi:MULTISPECIES: hypothetical protein [unclassified Neisseria]|uniref:hypothetical protein n=1 Tax=unclassified Neisseria TaxID=2623750 RepID=UPI00107259BA|nr:MULTISPECIES: hypothetical protein [unclassified Neisseria]MBF0804053.1 hypothetical protein [Neisseria sp. 19428wB4_WF04]TFU43194.1 hypothetical protein E4T99_06730 [Neisseria sp. WF04]